MKAHIRISTTLRPRNDRVQSFCYWTTSIKTIPFRRESWEIKSQLIWNNIMNESTIILIKIAWRNHAWLPWTHCNAYRYMYIYIFKTKTQQEFNLKTLIWPYKERIYREDTCLMISLIDSMISLEPLMQNLELTVPLLLFLLVSRHGGNMTMGLYIYREREKESNPKSPLNLLMQLGVFSIPILPTHGLLFLI